MRLNVLGINCVCIVGNIFCSCNFVICCPTFSTVSTYGESAVTPRSIKLKEYVLPSFNSCTLKTDTAHTEMRILQKWEERFRKFAALNEKFSSHVSQPSHTHVSQPSHTHVSQPSHTHVSQPSRYARLSAITLLTSLSHHIRTSLSHHITHVSQPSHTHVFGLVWSELKTTSDGVRGGRNLL